MGWFTSTVASGAFHAIWNLIWIWAGGTGLVVLLCVAGLYFKNMYFVYAAGAVFLCLTIFGYGQVKEHAVCDAKIKYVYLRTHTKAQDKAYIASHAKGKPAAHRACGELEYGCA